MKQINIGIVGMGTVGTGIAKLMEKNKDVISARLGAQLVFKKGADIDLERDRDITFAKDQLTTDPQAVTDDPDIAIVAEMIGGTGIAKEIITRAIENKKHVVTANKALLAEHGNELFELAARKGVNIAFEPSVGGCMPIIKTIRETMVSNRIEAVTGILNGTCNYILTKISNEGVAFADALKDAQDKGYAESDPTLDVDGFDTAHKLAIINALAYGMKINLNDIYIEGISEITPMDIGFARDCGYRIKLLAISKFDDGAVQARIHPTMVPFSNQLSNVSGSMNAVTVTGDGTGDMILFGRGAGMLPTATAALSDIADISRTIIDGGTVRVPMLSWQMNHIKEVPVRPIDDTHTHYYFRFTVIDRPGVLSKIAGILGRHDISIKSVHQIERKLDGGVPLFMLTHKAKEAHVQAAVKEISALEISTREPVLIRIEESEHDL